MAFSLEEAMTLTPSVDEEEVIPQKKGMSYDEAMGIGEPKVEEDEGVVSRSLDSLAAGIERTAATVVRAAPTVPYVLGAAPQNIVANLTGWNIGTKAPDWMMDNPITRHFEEGAKAYSYIQKKYPGKDAASLIKDGDYKAAGDYLLQASIENAPNTIALIAASLAGVPTPAVLGAAGAMQGAETYKQAREKNLTELEALSAGVVNGSYEAIFESMGGVGKLEKWGLKIAENVGKKGAKAVIYGTFKNVLGPVFGEMNEEFWTQLTQDFTNKMYEIEDIPWKDFPGRAIQAGAIAAVSGTAMAGGAQLKALQLRSSTPEELDQKRADEIIKQVEERKNPVVEETPAEPAVAEPSQPAVAPIEQPAVEQPEPVESFEPPSGVAETVGEDIEGVIEPGQMEELTQKTISEFVVGETDENGKTINAEDIDVEGMIIEGKPRKDVFNRARYLRDLEEANREPTIKLRDDVLAAAGRFYLDPKSDIAEEVRKGNIPKEFFTTETRELGGIESNVASFDDFAQSLRNNVPEIGPDATTPEIIEFLSGLNPGKKLSINQFIPAAQQQIVGEMQGKTLTRVTPGIKKAIRENTGQVQPAEDPTITESEALKAQMEIAEKASKEGFRAGKKVGVESVKSAKEIIQRRRSLVRSIRDSLQLTDDQLRQVSRKDIRLMDNYEFKKFVDDLELRATQLAEKREAKVRVLSTLHEKDFNKVENLRKFLELPSIDKMTLEQLEEFDLAMEDFETGDEFLSQRVLETLSKGELAGAKTIREVLEVYAKKIGKTVEELDIIPVGELNKVRYDTALARQNPFYRVLVDTVNSAVLEGDHQALEIEKEIDTLIEKARASRSRTIGEKLIPTDERIFNYLEAEKELKPELAKDMTPEELNAAGYLQQKWSQFRDYLIEQGVLEKHIENYVTHTRRGFMEAAKDDGMVNAFKEMLKQQEEDQSVAQILESDTGMILPLEKHFRFSMQRSGNLTPTKNVAKAFKVYMRAFYRKQAIDKINPAMMAYAYSLSPKGMTPRGLQMDRRLINFVKDFLNTKQGRLNDLGFIPQGGVIDRGLKLMDAYVTVKDLGFNVVSGLANQIGDPLSNVTAIGPKAVATGLIRMNTAKGKKMIEANRDFVGKSPWKDLADVAGDIGAKFHKSMFLLLSTASVRANKMYLLGSLTKEEWANGEISFERKAVLLREMGEYRAVHGSRSIIGSTSLGKFFTKYLSWAIPVANTTGSNIATLSKMVSDGDADKVFKTKEFQQLFRQVIISALVLFASKSMLDEVKDSKGFVGRLAKRSIAESMSLLSGLDPRMFFKPRMLSFLQSLATAVTMVPITSYHMITQDNKDLKKDLKTLMRESKNVFLPNAVKQLIPAEKKSSAAVPGFDFN